MTGMEIREVTPAEPELVDAWHGVYARADRHGREVAETWTLPEIRAAMATPSRRIDEVYLLGLVDGVPVVAATIEWPRLDNPEMSLVQVYVDPPVQRRGHGSAMLADVEARCHDAGRPLLIGETTWPYGLDGEGWPGVAFARAHGYERALVDLERRLALPVADRVLARLETEAGAHRAGYTLRSFTGSVPDDLLAAYAALDAAVDTEAPTGKLAIEPAIADAELVRSQNERLVAQRRTRCVTFALHGDEPVGYSELIVAGHEPGRAYQWGTLVRREHRGHRLGLAVKCANLRLAQREFPDLAEILTSNAEVNDHMSAINDALGFTSLGRMGEFQKRL